MPSRRRLLEAWAGAAGTTLAGCLGRNPGDGSPTPHSAKTGTVERHITAASVVSHEATRVETEEGQQWVVTVRLQLEAQDAAVATPRPVGVFFVFLDAEGDVLYEVHKQAPLNTGDGPDTATRSAPFEPGRAGQSTFHSYRTELVHP